jgi:hypothetical protein
MKAQRLRTAPILDMGPRRVNVSLANPCRLPSTNRFDARPVPLLAEAKIGLFSFSC